MIRYAVGTEKVREFVEAVGAADPVHHDVEVAREHGLPGLLAPPTFAMVVFGRALAEFLVERGVVMGRDTVLHSSQQFDYHRPLCAGDDVTCDLRLEGGRERGGDTVLEVAGEVTAGGDRVLTLRTTLLIRRQEQV